MASSSISPLSLLTITVLILSFSLSHNASPPPPPPPPPPFKKIYAFGDSYTDTGNTRSSTGPSSFTYVSNPPYGQTTFRRPTNRYSDGRLVIDFVAEALSLPYLPPYKDLRSDKTHGVNFAVAGSTAIIHSFFVKNNLTLNITPQSLQTQLGWFDEFLESVGCRSMALTRRECAAAFGDSLVWVGEIGANDYAYTVGSSVPSNVIQRLAIKSHTDFLEALLSKGAKYVVVQGLPTTGCLTLSMSLSVPQDRDDMGCVATVNKQSYSHNAVLQSNLADLRRRYPQAVIVYADYWNAYRTTVRNPSKYDFKELFKACCGSGGGQYNFDVFGACGSPVASSCRNPNQYINWDGVHLTEAMYKAVAESFLDGNFTHPPFEYLITMKQKSGCIRTDHS